MTTVVDVVDGDTVTLNDGRTVRIIGIDTPETVAPGKPVECWGPEATEFAQRTLLNQSVTVVEIPLRTGWMASVARWHTSCCPMVGTSRC